MSEHQSNSRVASPEQIQPTPFQLRNIMRIQRRSQRRKNRKNRSSSSKNRRPINDNDSVITESSHEPCSSSTVTRASLFQQSSTGFSHTGSSDLEDEDSHSTIEPSDSFYREKENVVKGVQRVISFCCKEIKANERISTAYTLRNSSGYYPDQAEDSISLALGSLKEEIFRRLDDEEQFWQRRLADYFKDKRLDVCRQLKVKSADIFDRGTELDQFFDILDRNHRLVQEIR